MKKTLLQYLRELPETILAPFFNNNSETFDFMKDLQRYGLLAFERLPSDTQYSLISMYYAVYK